MQVGINAKAQRREQGSNYSLDGLLRSPVSYGNLASRTSGAMGVVALQSSKIPKLRSLYVLRFKIPAFFRKGVGVGSLPYNEFSRIRG